MATLAKETIQKLAVTYKTSDHGEIIAESGLTDTVTFDGLDCEKAESLTDLVDDVLAKKILSRLREAQRHPARAEDWRSIYFGKKPARTK